MVKNYNSNQEWVNVHYRQGKKTYKGYVWRGRIAFNVGNFVSSSHNFYTVAANLHKFLYSKRYWYNSGRSKKIPSDIRTPKDTDCSAYVSWALYEYGYREFGGKQKVVSYFLAQAQHLKDHFYSNTFTGPISKKNVRSGDILIYKKSKKLNVKEDHMEIYAARGTNGKLYVLNAGNNRAIRNNATTSESNYSLRQVKYILRVKPKY